MKILKDIWSIIKELLILIASIFVFIPMGIVGVVYTFFKHLFKWDYSLKKQLSPIIRGITLAIDGFGNSGGGELLNDVNKIPKKSKVRYGKWYETVSAVTGLLIQTFKDLRLRKFVDKILGKKHCEEAIRPEQTKFYITPK